MSSLVPSMETNNCASASSNSERNDLAYILLVQAEVSRRWYGDGAGNNDEQNSRIFSLIQIC